MVNRHIREIRLLPEQGMSSSPVRHRLASLGDLHRLAITRDIANSTKIATPF
jgi:hypothetical protein